MRAKRVVVRIVRWVSHWRIWDRIDHRRGLETWISDSIVLRACALDMKWGTDVFPEAGLTAPPVAGN